MATSNNSAGVYSREIDLSAAVPSAALTVTVGAIVGQSNKGPVMQRTLITSVKEFIDVFGEPDPKVSYMHYSALAFLESSNRLYVTRVAESSALTAGAFLTVDDYESTPSATNPPVMRLNVWQNADNTSPLGKYDPLRTIAWTNSQGAPTDIAMPNVLGFFCAANPGPWNNSLYIRISPNTRMNQLPEDNEDPTLFKVEVFDDFNTLGTEVNIPLESFVVSREYRLDGFNRQYQIEEVINSKSNYIRFKANPFSVPSIPVYTSASEFLSGGTAGALVDTPTVLEGWELYRDPETINLTILINGGYTKASVQRKLDEIARYRKDCTAILDMPSDLQESLPNPYNPGAIAVQAVDGQIPAYAEFYVSQTLNLDSSYSAIYTPDVVIYDFYSQREVMIPPSGLVAAEYARTDYQYGTWFAPAGMNRGNLDIRRVKYTYDQAARDALTDNHINPIRVIPGQGFKIWGAETLQKTPTALSNINVRRLMNYLEKSISTASLNYVFDPNDSSLRESLVEVCNRILKPILAARGLYWFKVVCDETNNTFTTISNGDVILDVYVDPVLPAKRIHLNAIITRTGAIYNEIAADKAKRGS